MTRANYLPAPHYFNLSNACAIVHSAFGSCPYLVGSSLRTRDYRDVDIRVILEDAEYERLFPNSGDSPAYCALWSLMCASVSLWLSNASGLPVDFQIQKMSRANELFPQAEGNQRNALGIFLGYPGGH